MVIKCGILHAIILTCQTRDAYWYSVASLLGDNYLLSSWIGACSSHGNFMSWSKANGGEGHRPRVVLSTIIC